MGVGCGRARAGRGRERSAGARAAAIGAPGSGNPHEARRLSKPNGSLFRKDQWNALARTCHRLYREAAGRECLLTAGLESWLNRFRRKNFSERNGRRKMLELALR